MRLAAALILLPFAAHAAGNAPGPSEAPGVPVVAVEHVLATIRPGDDMTVLLALFTPDYRAEDNRRCDLNPCCPGCITDPIPAPVPLPGSGWLLLVALAGLVWAFSLVRLLMKRTRQINQSFWRD